MSKNLKGFSNPTFTFDNNENSKDSKYSQSTGRSDENIENYSDENYDPYKHRVVKHPTTYFDTIVHLLKGSLGTGILAMPAAFKNAGYITGAVGTVIIGVISLYCAQILVRISYEHCKRKKVPSMTYPQVAQNSLACAPGCLKKIAPYAIHITNVFLVIMQLGIACVYVVFVSSNIKSIVDSHTDKENWIDVRLYMCMILLPLIFINWIRNLKFLAPLTAIANVMTLISFGVILYYIFRDPIGFEDRDAFGTIKGFPLFLGTALFALEAIGVVLPLENEIEKPRNFVRPAGVLNIAMAITVTLYVGMGFFGYLKYGHDAEGSITLNLAPKEPLAQSVKAMFAFSIFITHSLACYVPMDIIWSEYVKKRIPEKSNKLMWEYLVRTCCVLITFIMAVIIPNLELFISLIGALCLAILGLSLPAVMHYATWWDKCDKNARIKLIIIDTFIFIVGIVGFVVGTAISLTEIIAKFSNIAEN